MRISREYAPQTCFLVLAIVCCSLVISGGCQRQTEMVIPSYMKDENGDVKKMSEEEIEALRQKAKDLREKRARETASSKR